MPLPPLSNPKKLTSRFAGKLCGSIAVTILFPALIIINLLQTLSLIIKPISSAGFRHFNRWAANTWWGWCDILAQKIYKVQIVQSGDAVPSKENAIVILNHQGMVDIPVLFSFANAKKRLGDLKWYVKDILKYVPGVGWGMLFLDCLFIKRNWVDDKNYIHRVFDKILKHKVPLWIVSFVEGTRARPEKLIRAQKYAEEKGFKPLKHLLIPRTKGFTTTVQALRSHISAVYDVTIGYTDGVPTLWQWAQGYVKKVNLYVRRYDIHGLPKENDALASWLISRFEEKDILLDQFYRQNCFLRSERSSFNMYDPATLMKRSMG